MVEGQLKLIDFGIAKAISSDTTSIARESQVGLEYMHPALKPWYMGLRMPANLYWIRTFLTTYPAHAQ